MLYRLLAAVLFLSVSFNALGALIEEGEFGVLDPNSGWESVLAFTSAEVAALESEGFQPMTREIYFAAWTPFWDSATSGPGFAGWVMSSEYFKIY